ncbi:hypothetical protein GUJ93_ZPchr0010g9086 [Zizania palustris]|uniref:Protein kinase domain-containing protein n=1 Tax=Zizania palustris TaxID=103762 RepID=A0A8J5W9Y7_ZIZPA|nr:hypothetical protein GUJ93_ZPchr0010g9086 [Zizania palustris]
MGRVLGRSMEDVRATYTFGSELGRGQFGVTYLATHKPTGRRYACKSIAAGASSRTRTTTSAGRCRSCTTSPATATSSSCGAPTRLRGPPLR